MAENSFKPERFFGVEGFRYPALFDGVEAVWEVLPQLSDFIEKLFQEGNVKGNFQGKKDVYVGEGTVVEEYALIKGPAIIGKNAFIGHAAYLRGGCIAGDNVHVGHGTEVKHSIVMNDSAVAHLNYICDSIIGSNVNIGAGAKTANLRLDERDIRVKTADNVIDTKLRKLGAIVGDGSKIGVNAVLNPGTILGKGCIVYPLVSVVGVYEEGETIR